MEAMFTGALTAILNLIAAVGGGLCALGLAISGVKYQASTTPKGKDDAMTWVWRALFGLALTCGPTLIVTSLRSWIGV